MTTLIERVAKAAGWKLMPQPLRYWYVYEWNPLATTGGKLTPAGILVLLEELLSDTHAVTIVENVDGTIEASAGIDDASVGNTLAEAVMLAFLAMKGEP